MDGVETRDASSSDAPRSFIPRRPQIRLFVLLAVLMFVALIAAYLRKETTILGATALGFLGGTTLFFAVRLGASLARGEHIGLESTWGGLGRGLGGWSLSAPLAYLLAFSVSGALFVAVLRFELVGVAIRPDNASVSPAASRRRPVDTWQERREVVGQDGAQEEAAPPTTPDNL